MASRIRRLRARALKALFRSHTVLYERSGGRIGHTLGGLPMLLLTVKGRKSGLPRTTPLVYFEDQGRYVVVGSDGAARRDPQWWKNLKVDPMATVRIGRRVMPMRASLAEGEERARLWAIGTGINPMWERYQGRTRRVLPVVILDPQG